MGAIQELFRQIGNLFRWWFVVAPWEQAVRVRMGTKVDVLDAGVHLRIPIADRIFRQSIRRRFTTVPTQTVTTLDGKTVTISGGIGYSIKDIGMLYDTLHDAEDTVQIAAQGVVAKFIAERQLSSVQPSEIEGVVPEALKLEQYGLGEVEFCVTDFAVVRTYRLIDGAPKDWTSGSALNTNEEHSMPGVAV